MQRILYPLTVAKALKPLKIDRVRRLSSSCYQGNLASVDTIRNNVSKFVIRSRTTNPFLNLAIEDHLLRVSDPKTHILFTYVNRPCVVIGRNQNPWLETNFAALSNGFLDLTKDDRSARQELLLVRRRSGGGTVFHDEGNLNYSFIVPNDKAFNRNKHAEMVVQAIRGISPKLTCEGERLLSPALKDGIRVNERHDIVMPARIENGPIGVDETRMVKVSGSAYKLTRGRALHHGTLLFSSPNVKSIGGYLRSPARAFIDAKGVESVRSPIGNLRFSWNALIREALRGEVENSIAKIFSDKYKEGHISTSSVDEFDTKDHRAIKAGVAELKSPEWKYLQTPSFTFTTQQLVGESFEPAALPCLLPRSTKVVLKARHGIITESHISLSDNQDVADAEAQQIRAVLQNQKLHEIDNWSQVFASMEKCTHPSTGALAGWLSEMFPPVPG
jgi:lipoate---protein ligase